MKNEFKYKMTLLKPMIFLDESGFFQPLGRFGLILFIVLVCYAIFLFFALTFNIYRGRQIAL